MSRPACTHRLLWAAGPHVLVPRPPRAPCVSVRLRWWRLDQPAMESLSSTQACKLLQDCVDQTCSWSPQQGCKAWPAGKAWDALHSQCT